jgi:type IV secretory pathway component VirB8
MPEGIVETTQALAPAALSAWPSDPLTDDSREVFYNATLGRQQSVLEDAARIRRLGTIYGASGLAVAVIAVLSATAVYLKTPVPPPPGYILVDKTEGTISQPVNAVQAPAIFPEVIRERSLRDFVTACESYVPETFLKVDWHNCMIMAVPEEQKLIAAEIGPKGSRDPSAIFVGPGKPQAIVTKFTEMKKLGEAGVNPNQTFHYQVRYERIEFSNGKESRPHYTAQIYFQFHPELKATPNDRLVNPYGLQVVSFSTTPD